VRRTRRAAFACTALAILAATTALGNGPTQARAPLIGRRLDAYLRPLAAAREFNGTILVAAHGRVLLDRGYGWADRTHRRANGPDTRFRLAGLLLFNTVAAYQLRDAGRVALDDSVCRFVAPCPASWRPVTVQSLLDGRSGLPDAWPLARRARKASLAAAVAWLTRRPLRGPPRRGVDTSPVAQLVLAHVVERASGSEWAAYVQRNVWRPAGMTHTGVTASVPGQRRAVGYLLPRLERGRDVEFTRPDPVHGVWSTAGDVYRFLRALYGNRLLKAETREELFPSSDDYVAGLHGYDRVQSMVRDGWYELLAHHGRDGIDVVMLMNGRKGQYRFYEIELELARIAHAAAGTPVGPKPLPPEPVLVFTGTLGVVTLASDDGSHRTGLTAPYAGQAFDPLWSPAGDRVLFTRCHGEACAVYVVRADGVGERRLTAGTGVLWLDAGHVLVRGASRAWRVDVASGAKRPAARVFAGISSRAALSPDGTKLLYLSRPYGVSARDLARGRGARARNRLLIADVASGASRPLRGESGFYLITANAWSPDGSSIAFVRRPRLGSFRGELFVASADGTMLSRVASNGGNGVSWSPDGSRLVFNVGIGCQIRILDLTSATTTTLPGEGCQPSWRPGKPG
jgi:CubicO group peptidase (beta-lactamase class C family)